MLRITKEQFLKVYEGTKLVQYVDTFYTDPVDNKDLLENYLPSKLWRLNNLYTIVNKHGERVRFNMNLSQHKVYAGALKHPRIIILKSRQQGISTLWLVSFFDDGMMNENFSIGLMAQGQDEAATLLERTKILWDNYPANYKAILGIGIDTNNTKALSFSNGSTIFVRTSFRSTTLQRLHISEMGKIANKYPEKAQETKTGTLQAIAPGNIAVIESTAEGDNLFKTMWDNAMTYSSVLSNKDFMPIFLSWIDDPDCVEPRDQIETNRHKKYFEEVEANIGFPLTKQQRNFWIVQERELGDKIYQEYPSTAIEAFMVTKDGAYYARQYIEYIKTHKREIVGLYDENLDVHAVADLGMNDTNTLLFFQVYDKDQIRFIDEIVDNNQPISYYCDEIKKKPYLKNLRSLYLPHDGAVTELTSGKSRIQVFREELAELTDFYVDILERTGVNDGIDQVRRLMSRLWIDPSKCEYIIKCLLNYTKEYDEKRERWRDKPNHDQYSHGADAVRYAAMRLLDLVGSIGKMAVKRYSKHTGVQV